jgi:hypothetical protein
MVVNHISQEPESDGQHRSYIIAHNTCLKVLRGFRMTDASARASGVGIPNSACCEADVIKRKGGSKALRFSVTGLVARLHYLPASTRPFARKLLYAPCESVWRFS